MSINKEFQVRHGLSVNNTVLTANVLTNRVGVNTSNAQYTLDVNGSVNIANPTLLVAGINVLSSISSSNLYSVQIGAASNAWANSVGTAGNNYTNAVGLAGNNYTNTVGVSGNNYAIQIGAASNTWANSIGISSNSYAIQIGDSSNTWANAVGTAGNNYTNAVGTAGNNYTNFVGSSANSYSLSLTTSGNLYTVQVGAASNSWSNSVGTASNNYTNTLATAGNNYTNAAGAAGNNYAVQIGSSSNAWTNSVATAGNNYTNAVGVAGNNYSIQTGAASNAWANSVGTAGNNYTNAVGAAGNNYTNAVGVAGNNYTNSVGLAANNYANATYFQKTGGTISGAVSIAGNFSVTGNLTVTGNTSYVSVQNYRVDDPLIYIAGNNYISDIVDIGFIANYVNTTGSNVHTGLYREHENKQWYLFQGYDAEPDNNHIGAMSNNMTLAVLNADLRTSNLVLAGINAISWISSAFDKANSANVLAYNTGIGANAYSAAVGTAGNNYSIQVGASSNNWANTLSISDRAFANDTANSANAYSITIGSASNNWSNNLSISDRVFANAIGAAGNAYAVTIGSASNNYAVAIGAASNNYAIQVGISSNSWANTKLSNVIAGGPITISWSSTGGYTDATINVALSGVTPATYGSNVYVPVITVDSYGRITSASNVAVSGGGGGSMDYPYADAIGAASNAWANSVGTAGNNYAVQVSAAGNNYTNAVGVAGNNYTNAVGAAGNNYTNAIGTIGNNYTNAVGTAGNNYTNAVVAAGNNYTNAVGASSNNWSNTKVASVTGTSGQIFVQGTTTPTLNLVSTGVSAVNYGGSTQIPVFKVDDFGRLTYAANVPFTSSSSVDTSDSPPISPTDGMLWWNSSLGKLFIYYDDGNSSQWVDAAPPVVYLSDPLVTVAFDVANNAYTKANSANVLAYNTGIGANSYANTVASQVGIIAIAAFDKANTSGPKSEWIIKNTNYTANVGDKIYCNTLAGFITITLPASPGIGNNVFVASGYNASNANVTIERNGSTIMGLSENLVITETNISVDFVYDGSSWRIA